MTAAASGERERERERQNRKVRDKLPTDDMTSQKEERVLTQETDRTGEKREEKERAVMLQGI